MATQLAETHDADDTGDEGQSSAIDYEVEARKWGWKPPEELKDPTKGLDAKAFYERGQEVLPLVKAQVRALEKRLEIAEKTGREAAVFYSKTEQRAYDRAVADIRAEMDLAVESGDAQAGRAALEKMTNLEKPGQPTASAPVDPAQRAEEFADWMTENRWYATPDMQALRIYADAQADKIVADNGGNPLSRADLDELAGRVKAKYGKAYPEAFGDAPTPKPRNAVDGGGSAPRTRGGKTAADLPDGGAQMRRFIRNGVVKDEATYLKDYDWS